MNNLPNPNPPRVRRPSVAFSTSVDRVEAKWGKHVNRVYIRFGGVLNVFLDTDDAVRLANQLTDAVDEADSTPAGEQS